MELKTQKLWRTIGIKCCQNRRVKSKLEAVDDEMEKSFTTVSRGIKQSNGRIMMLEEWNEVMDGETKRYSELAEIELKRKDSPYDLE